MRFSIAHLIILTAGIAIAAAAFTDRYIFWYCVQTGPWIVWAALCSNFLIGRYQDRNLFLGDACLSVLMGAIYLAAAISEIGFSVAAATGGAITGLCLSRLQTKEAIIGPALVIAAIGLAAYAIRAWYETGVKSIGFH